MKPYRIKPYTHPSRPHFNFVVAWREAGRRKHKFYETRRAAEIFVRQKEIELANGGIEAAQFPTRLRVAAQHADSLLAPFGKTISDAAEFYVAHLKASEKSCTVGALVKELLAAKKADGASDRYREDLKNRLKKFEEQFTDRTVSTITGAEVDDWLRGLKTGEGKPVSPTTRNNFRRLLIVGFNFAVQRGYTTTNPAIAAAKAKQLDSTPGILTVQQTADLLNNAPKEILPLLAIGCFAGLRPAELARLHWQDVDFDAALIEVTAKKSKTARRRFIKMQPNLTAWLTPFKGDKGRVSPANARKLQDRARSAAGLDEWPDNALRHGFASYHLAHFNDAAALALQMGHIDSGMIFKHYRQLVKPAEGAKYWNVFPKAS